MRKFARAFVFLSLAVCVFIGVATLRYVTFVEYFFPQKFIPILQGWTDPNSTQIAVIYDSEKKLRYKAYNAKSGVEIPVTTEEDFSHTDSIWHVRHLSFQGLELGEKYSLKVENGHLQEIRYFSTLDTHNKKARIAFGSCANKNFPNPEIWQALAKSKPDLVLFLGDQMYADKSYFFVEFPATPKQLWQNYVASFHSEGFYNLKNLIPTLTIWDDHDFGVNDGGYEYAASAESLEIAKTFYLQKKTKLGPGYAQHYNLFGLELFLLDGRTFRGPKTDPDATMLGQTQERWLAKEISENTKGPILLASGSSFFASYAEGESFAGEYPNNFQKFLSHLKLSKVPLMFISGDLHYGEVSKIESSIFGYETYELLSSPFHSNIYPGQNNFHINPRRVFSVNEYNFFTLDSNMSTQGNLNKVDFVVNAWSSQFTNFFMVSFGYNWNQAGIKNRL